MSTALLVIDLQRAAFDGVRCPPIDDGPTLIAGAAALIDAARAGGHRVVYVRHGEGAGEPFEVGSPHWALHEALVPAPAEWIADKRASSAFDDTDLDRRLRADGIDTLVLCGLQSEFCVSNTARSALALGYRVQLARGAHGTWTWNGRAAREIRAEVDAGLAEAGVHVTDTGDLAAQLAGSPRG